MKNNSGFTLIELMVVVAIIGLIAAIGIPNYIRYQAKSKQSEAKIQLAAIYSVETGAFAAYETYATCVGELGYDTPERGYYITGFAVDHPATIAILSSKGGVCNTGNATHTPSPNHLKVGATASIPGDLASVNVNPTISTFTAGAAGNISVTVPLDKWKINEEKTISNALQGY